MNAAATQQPVAAVDTAKASGLICSSVIADTVGGMLTDIQEAKAAGVNVIEVKLDYLSQFDPETDIKQLLEACKPMPAIITYRPDWEG